MIENIKSEQKQVISRGRTASSIESFQLRRFHAKQSQRDRKRKEKEKSILIKALIWNDKQPLMLSMRSFVRSNGSLSNDSPESRAIHFQLRLNQWSDEQINIVGAHIFVKHRTIIFGSLVSVVLSRFLLCNVKMSKNRFSFFPSPFFACRKARTLNFGCYFVENRQQNEQESELRERFICCVNCFCQIAFLTTTVTAVICSTKWQTRQFFFVSIRLWRILVTKTFKDKLMLLRKISSVHLSRLWRIKFHVISFDAAFHFSESTRFLTNFFSVKNENSSKMSRWIKHIFRCFFICLFLWINFLHNGKCQSKLRDEIKNDTFLVIISTLANCLALCFSLRHTPSFAHLHIRTLTSIPFVQNHIKKSKCRRSLIFIWQCMIYNPVRQ